MNAGNIDYLHVAETETESVTDTAAETETQEETESAEK